MDLDVEKGIKQRDAMIKYYTDQDGKNLGHDIQISVQVSAYQPNLLKGVFNHHQAGISIQIGVTNGKERVQVADYKVWDTGFDTGMKFTDSVFSAPLRGRFPFCEESERWEVEGRERVEEKILVAANQLHQRAHSIA